MRKFVFGNLLMLGALTALSILPSTAATYKPDFKALDPDWLVIQPNAVKASGGILTLMDAKGDIPEYRTKSLRVADMTCSVKAQFAKVPNLPDTGAKATLEFLMPDSSHGYEFSLSSIGTYQIYKFDSGKDGKPTALVPWTANEAIKKGPADWNEMKVVIEGQRGSFYVNGTLLTSLPLHVPEGGGMIGLECINNEPVEVKYKDFELVY